MTKQKLHTIAQLEDANLISKEQTKWNMNVLGKVAITLFFQKEKPEPLVSDVPAFDIADNLTCRNPF